MMESNLYAKPFYCIIGFRTSVYPEQYSNPRPPACKLDVLTSELSQQLVRCNVNCFGDRVTKTSA